MSPVDFKKWPCSLSFILKIPCLLYDSPMSPVNLKKGSVTLSNLRVKGPNSVTVGGLVLSLGINVSVFCKFWVTLGCHVLMGGTIVTVGCWVRTSWDQ